MIAVKVYKNGFEIIGHDAPSICSQVSMWGFIVRHFMSGYHDNVKSYDSCENSGHENEGYTWIVFDANCETCKWAFDDFIASFQKWNEDVMDSKVIFEYVDELLIKGDAA
jgi:hypothetical protein